MTLTQAYVLLAVAIAGEIISTGTLKATDGFTKWQIVPIRTWIVLALPPRTSARPWFLGAGDRFLPKTVRFFPRKTNSKNV